MPERMFRVAASVATKTVAGGRAKVFHRCNHRPTGFTGERRRPGGPVAASASERTADSESTRCARRCKDAWCVRSCRAESPHSASLDETAGSGDPALQPIEPVRPGGDFPLALKTKFEIVEQSFMRHVRILAVQCGASHVAYGLFSGGPGRWCWNGSPPSPSAPATRPRMIGWSRSAPRSGNCCGGRGCTAAVSSACLDTSRSIACFGFRPCRPGSAGRSLAFEQRQGTATAEENGWEPRRARAG